MASIADCLHSGRRICPAHWTADAAGSLRSWTTLYFGTELRLRVYARLFSHLVRLPVSFFEKRNLGDIISRFDSAEAIQRTLSQ